MNNLTYEQITTQSIEKGFDERDEFIIGKETEYVLFKLMNILPIVFSDRMKHIHFKEASPQFCIQNLLAPNNRKNLKKWIEFLKNVRLPLSEEDFGKLKVDLDYWYYELTGEELVVEYQPTYLLTPQEAADQLGISKVTFLKKYVNEGIECVDTTSHRKIPKYVVAMLQSPLYSLRMQQLAQEKKRLTQTPQERLQEIMNQLTAFQIQYQAVTPYEAFAGRHEEEMDDPTDYREWIDLEEEKREIMNSLGVVRYADQ